MHRMRNDIKRLVIPALVLVLSSLGSPSRGELIRPHGFRAYPNIAGEMAGEQTYEYDALSQTGVFRVTNAPHVITLGPTGRQMINVMPDVEGTLNETLNLTLDREGRLVDQDDNNFELRGSVTIGGQVYEGLLLTGRPTAFGAQTLGEKAGGGAGIFDLSLKVTGGKLAKAFGPEAYFRITPQVGGTFQGTFAENFSGDRPLTSLRASRSDSAPIPVPEPTLLLFMATVGGGCIAARSVRRRRFRRRQALAASLSRPASAPTACLAPRSRSAGPAPSSARGTRRSP
ncbi:hypothetical protein [Planctomyces sp. SH-PL62]|uniref:hypothetical protein n=1 Tax=Planctomyces sp. SH-PL62 TaxID=1636152 RepID=UPI00078B7B4A|nr:hypothetical protein [Planctomyces sp. SH-PL62]AMV37220.1 hypothetical protein VT85_07295 [Planctomyces sp. SH-PL62]